MPLPSALQARLQKRGLVIPEPDKDEEVIVDNKSEESLQPPKKNYKLSPLPPGWFKVPEPQRKSEYYWNVHTNQVSWRHPLDPLAEITYPASWQQKSKQDIMVDDMKKEETKKLNDNNKDRPRDVDKSEERNKSRIKTGKHPSLIKAHKQRERNVPNRKRNDELDPMDPASYSDIGRGTWSSGLKDETDQKTGVDTTANGPLFQQRPYPSPGDILRRNKKKEPDFD